MTYEYQDYLEDRLSDTMEDILKADTDHSLLWEGLGPDAFRTLHGLPATMKAEAAKFEEDYTLQIRDAVMAGDSTKLGKLLMALIESYVESAAEDKLYDDYPDYLAGREDYYYSMRED